MHRLVAVAVLFFVLFLVIGAVVSGQERAADVKALKAERALVLKTTEAAQLKLQLLQTQLQLLQVLLQQGALEAQQAEAAEQEFDARARKALGIKDGEIIEWDALPPADEGTDR